jgi:hypothetical protein
VRFVDSTPKETCLLWTVLCFTVIPTAEQITKEIQGLIVMIGPSTYYRNEPDHAPGLDYSFPEFMWEVLIKELKANVK